MSPPALKVAEETVKGLLSTMPSRLLLRFTAFVIAVVFYETESRREKTSTRVYLELGLIKTRQQLKRMEYTVLTRYH